MSEPTGEGSPTTRRLNSPQKFVIWFFYLMAVAAVAAALVVPASNATGRLAPTLIAICALGGVAVVVGFPLMFFMAWREARRNKRQA